jgi:hypothetical protein
MRYGEIQMNILKSKFDRQAATIFTACAIAIGACVSYAIYEQNQWDAFASENNCKLIAHKDSTVGYGLQANGKMGTIVIDATNTYRCADGVDYTR